MPSFLRFWNWAEETVDAKAEICGSAENVLKQKPSKHLRKWIARFYYFVGIYTPLKRIVYCSPIIAPNLPIVAGQLLSYLLINILYGSFQLFLPA